MRVLVVGHAVVRSLSDSGSSALTTPGQRGGIVAGRSGAIRPPLSVNARKIPSRVVQDRGQLNQTPESTSSWIEVGATSLAASCVIGRKLNYVSRISCARHCAAFAQIGFSRIRLLRKRYF